MVLKRGDWKEKCSSKEEEVLHRHSSILRHFLYHTGSRKEAIAADCNISVIWEREGVQKDEGGLHLSKSFLNIFPNPFKKKKYFNALVPVIHIQHHVMSAPLHLLVKMWWIVVLWSLCCFWVICTETLSHLMFYCWWFMQLERFCLHQTTFRAVTEKLCITNQQKGSLEHEVRCQSYHCWHDSKVQNVGLVVNTKYIHKSVWNCCMSLRNCLSLDLRNILN